MSVLAGIRTTTRNENTFTTELVFEHIVPRALHYDEFKTAVRTAEPGTVIQCRSPRAQRPAPCTIIKTEEGRNDVTVRFVATGTERKLDRQFVHLEGDWAPYADRQVLSNSLTLDQSQQARDTPTQRVRLGDDVCFGKSNWLRPERGRVVRWSNDDKWDAEVVITPSDRRDAPWTEVRRNISFTQLADVISEKELAVAAPTADWSTAVVQTVRTKPPQLEIIGPWRVQPEYSPADVVRLSKDGSPYQLGRMVSVYGTGRMGSTQYISEFLDPDAGGRQFIGMMEPNPNYAWPHPRYQAPELLQYDPPANDAKGWAARKPAKNAEREKAKAQGGAAAETLGLHLVFNEVPR